MKTLIRVMQVQPDKILPGARAGYLLLPAGGLPLCLVIRYPRTLRIHAWERSINFRGVNALWLSP